jgi:hypothetical protein
MNNDHEPMTFDLVEFNPRRVARGVEGARVRITYFDGATELLWMYPSDIMENLETFGDSPGLQDALTAYQHGARV